jgi:hypothetical protein
MINKDKQRNLCNKLIVESCDDMPYGQMISAIKHHIIESKDVPIIRNTANALNFLSSISEDVSFKTLDKHISSYKKLNEFILENNLRFPLEEMVVEEFVKSLTEDEGTVAEPAPTNTTSGVAKVELPIDQKPIKRKQPVDLE